MPWLGTRHESLALQTKRLFPPPCNNVRRCMRVLFAGDESTVSSSMLKGHTGCPLHFTSAHCACCGPDSALAGWTDGRTHCVDLSRDSLSLNTPEVSSCFHYLVTYYSRAVHFWKRTDTIVRQRAHKRSGHIETRAHIVF